MGAEIRQHFYLKNFNFLTILLLQEQAEKDKARSDGKNLESRIFYSIPIIIEYRKPTWRTVISKFTFHYENIYIYYENMIWKSLFPAVCRKLMI